MIFFVLSNKKGDNVEKKYHICIFFDKIFVLVEKTSYISAIKNAHPCARSQK